MAMKSTDRILAASRGDVRTVLEHAAANGAARQPFLAQYVGAVFELCSQPDTPDAAVVIAQSSEETAAWTSFWWRTHGNPAGIGITGDPEEDTASEVFETGLEAANAHVAHLLLYATGTIDAAGLTPADDPRYTEYVRQHGRTATATTIAGLAETWATDPEYAPKVCTHGNAIWPTLPDQEEPMADPVIYDLATDYARFGLSKAEAQTILAKRFTSRVDGAVRGRPTHIMFHIQAGNTRGSLKYWVGVSASSTVMIQRDGSILRVIPEAHGPWTNGDDYAPTPAGQPLVNQPGNSNIWTLSMEVEGGSGAEVLNEPEQMAAIEWQARDWMTRYPDTAQPGHQLRHADVQQIERPNCPGAYYPVIMERLALPPTPPVAIPTISWTPGETGIGDMHGTKVLRFAIEVTAKRKTVPHVGANAKTKQYGDSIKPGEKRIAYGSLDSGWLFIQDDQNQDAFPRVSRSAFYPLAPRPRDAA